MSGDMQAIYNGGEEPADPSVADNMLRFGSPDLSSISYAFDSSSFDLSLPAEKQAGLMETIEAIFKSDRGELGDEDQEMLDADEDEPEVDLADQKERTEKLKRTLPTIAQLWWCRSQQMVLAIQQLADASRNRKLKCSLLHMLVVAPQIIYFLGFHIYNFHGHDEDILGLLLLSHISRIQELIVVEKWRIPLGDSGILSFFLQTLNTHVLEPELKIQILRLVGNACADTGTAFLLT